MDWIKLLLRLTFGGFMLTAHGLSKLSKLSADPVVFPDPLHVGMPVSLSLTVFGEVFCSALIILGLFTRLSAIPLILTMLVAVFVIHGADPFIQREMAVLYLVAFISISYLKGGKFSLDYLIRKKS